MIDSNIKLNTWLDIQECFIKSRKQDSWPSIVQSVNCYWDQIQIAHSETNPQVIEDWLKELFDPRIHFDSEEISILLADDSTKIQIINETLSDEDIPVRPFIRPSISVGSNIYREYIKPELNGSPLEINTIAFHSFKGGVGRTLHSIALAKALADTGKKILLVDGDFEAPGITYLAKEAFTIDYSYADLLGTIHADPSETLERSIDFAVKSLANQKIENIFILPSFRTEYQQQNFEIKPEHIIQNFDNAFILPEILSKIAAGLDIDFIIIDLRAGLSELSTGILLDPRVEKFLVSSINSQSLEGTKVLLDLIKNFSNEIDYQLPEIRIVLNNISDVYSSNRDMLDTIKNELSNVYFGEVNELESDSVYDIEFIESLFNPDLLILTNNIQEYFARLEKAGIDKRFNLNYNQDVNIPTNDLASKRSQLSLLTEEMIFAERGTADNILWTQPLKRLAEGFSTKLPNVVISGAKGAGKTLIFTNLIKARNWRSFLQKGHFNSEIDAIVLPVLKPSALSGVALDDYDLLKVEISEYLSLRKAKIDASNYIESMFRDQLTAAQWTTIWINAIAIASGFESPSSSNEQIGEEFLNFLRSQNKKAVALFDGLEDLFQEIGSDSKEYQKDALRALIQRVPDYLAQQPNSPLGILVLIRQDYIEYSILQNSAQFMDRYKMFHLKWNVDEALKLVWHVSNHVLPSVDGNLEQNGHRSEIVSALIPLWGLKLGAMKSKEAHSANWILTALSDWNGQIQARDLIRFLHAAARDSQHQTAAEDRILAVTAIKTAVEECSIEKISEISQENLVLREIFNDLKELADKKTPFVSSELPITTDKLKILVDNGIIYKEVAKGVAEQYHIAEIYRHGLGFAYKGRKMTKMLAFRRAIES